MSLAPPPPRALREPFLRCLLRTVSVGALTGAAAGAAESAKLLAQGEPRYADWALGSVVVGVVGYALLGAFLALACAPFAWLLWRRPEHRAAPPSSAAILGTALALASFLLVDRIGIGQILPAALAATLLCLALREMLAWWPILTSARPYAVVLVLALLFGAGMYAWRGGRDAGKPARGGGAGAPEGANVVLITIDTLRADHLGCYGNPNAKTPNIDALAKESVVFEDATSQANTTGPSHTTMLTGLYPVEHGAVRNGVPLAHRVETLPEILARSGYRTAAFVSGFTLKHEACGLAPRFERYDDELIAWRWMPEAAARLRLVQTAIQFLNRRGVRLLRADRPSEETVDAALDWLAERSADEPFFLWMHSYDPHAPYEPPPPYDRMHDPEYPDDPAMNWYTMSTAERRELVADERELAHMRALYAGEISYADEQVGRLLQALRESGQLDRTLVILTSDHGEGLGEHGYYFDHGTFLYDNELRVPLLMRLPGAASAGRRIEQQTRLLDLAPSVLDVLGFPPLSASEGASGASFLALLHENGVDSKRPSFAIGELSGELAGYELDGRKHSLRSHGFKLILTTDYWLDSVRIPENLELYDLSKDPGEEQNLWPLMASDGADLPKDLKEMRFDLDLWWQLADQPYVDTADPIRSDVRDQLRRIGYH